MVDANPEALAYRPFGQAGFAVPPVSVGCAPIGDMPEAFAYGVSEADALATIRAALDSPLPYIDTAALYGDGESERRVGLVLRERGGLPADAFLQTKQGRNPADNNYSGDTVKRRMERSLRLLGVDRIEIVYLHDPEWTTFEAALAPSGPVEVLQRFKEEGVIGRLGVAGGPIPVEIQYVETGLFDAVITHNRYTLLNRSADPLLTLAHEKGLAVLNAAPYGSGLLAKGPDAYPRYAYQQASPEMIERVRRIADVCARYDVPVPAVALQFSTRDPRICNTIVGMSKPERLAQTVEYLSLPIPDAVWEDLAEVPFDADDPETHRFQR